MLIGSLGCGQVPRVVRPGAGTHGAVYGASDGAGPHARRRRSSSRP